jgi:hypothetical protein
VFFPGDGEATEAQQLAFRGWLEEVEEDFQTRCAEGGSRAGVGVGGGGGKRAGRQGGEEKGAPGVHWEPFESTRILQQPSEHATPGNEHDKDDNGGTDDDDDGGASLGRGGGGGGPGRRLGGGRGRGRSRERKAAADAGCDEEWALAARRELRAGEVVGFVSGATRAIDPTSETTPRWRPSDRLFYLSDHPDMPPAPEDGSGTDPDGGGGAGGVFIVAVVEEDADADQVGDEDGGRDEDGDGCRDGDTKPPPPGRQAHISAHTVRTRGTHAPCAVREAWTCRREPFLHPVLGECLALVAEEDIPAGGAITQPPDYAAGWRLDPRSVGRRATR